MPKHKQAGQTTVLTKMTANIDRKRLQCRSHPQKPFSYIDPADSQTAISRRQVQTIEERTKRSSTFGAAAFFYAENVRTRGGAFSATQRISPNHPFNRIDFAEVQTTHSLPSVSTIETRTKRTCVFAAIRVQNVKIMVPVYVRQRRLLLSSKTTGDELFQGYPLRKTETWHILPFN